LQAGNHPKQGAFATAVAPRYHHYLAGGHLQRQIIKHPPAPIIEGNLREFQSLHNNIPIIGTKYAYYAILEVGSVKYEV
jgi:hypothetical protein